RASESTGQRSRTAVSAPSPLLVTAAPIRSPPPAVGMLEEARRAGDVLDGDEIRERMSGNLCRCGAYVNIVDAIAGAAPAAS
ncbi:MAG: xanthine dehydrogenase YagT iron-sulfur-binding subunit, partial [Baekduia sp.]|nr:xanthine dehydrogenase YagT iron-sulfur-binding subunit [Baekduia sp.]